MSSWPELEGKRILVTGATGFIGGRIVERLAQETGARVRVAVRNLSRLPRIARFDIEIVECDLIEQGQVARAVGDSQLVFHCAYGNRGNVADQARVTVEGTRNLLEAARLSGVERLVHFSTFSVYGVPRNTVITETSARQPSGQGYADNKLKAERLVEQYARKGVPTTILQPTVVYGPFGTTWTSEVLGRLQTGRSILVNGGLGICNPVYVDDVVTAAFLAATQTEAVGETFLVSGEGNVTWAEFVGAFERMLGRSATVAMPEQEALRHWKRSSRRPLLWRQLIRLARGTDILPGLLNTWEGDLALRASRRFLPGGVRRKMLNRLTVVPSASASGEHIHPVNPDAIRFFTSSATVSIHKAETLLGYRPAFSLERGMQLTELWAEWAGLLGSAEPAGTRSGRP